MFKNYRPRKSTHVDARPTTHDCVVACTLGCVQGAAGRFLLTATDSLIIIALLL